MDRLALMRTRLAELASSSGKRPFDHIKVYADDAQVLVDVIDRLMQYQASVTTGGPPAPFTTPRPEQVVELSVAVPVTDEEAVQRLSERRAVDEPPPR